MSDRNPYPRDGKGVQCPWQTIARCPLYIASHEAKGRGCVDDMAEPCIINRGETTYRQLVINLIGAGFVPEDAGHLEALPVAGAA
jgi:hypothetical protein